jgi:protocatechuate 3,4-dioxygenase beta subunit
MSKHFIYRRAAPGTQPDYLHSPYVSTIKRAPKYPPIHLPHTLTEVTGPVFDASMIDPKACDLTQQHAAPPLGERIIISGCVLDENARAIPHTLVEIWQANSAGRYRHAIDQHNAPLDPNFTGAGHMLTDKEGNFRFVTIRPGSYPWRNHYNAWRPAHIHFSVFGPAFATRMVTQMYFPGDPLLPHDPIFNCVPDEAARDRLISQFDWDTTVSDHALGYKFDLVLAGRDSLPWEAAHK